MNKPLKAYRVIWIHMPDVEMFGAGESAGQIRYMFFLSGAEANYLMHFQDLLVKRVPELDKDARKSKPGHIGWCNVVTGEAYGSYFVAAVPVNQAVRP